MLIRNESLYLKENYPALKRFWLTDEGSGAVLIDRMEGTALTFGGNLDYTPANGVSTTAGNEAASVVAGSLPTFAADEHIMFSVTGDFLADNTIDDGDIGFGLLNTATPNAMFIGNNPNRGTGFVDSDGTVISFTAPGTSASNNFIMAIDRSTNSAFLWQKGVGAATLIQTITGVDSFGSLDLSLLSSTGFHMEKDSSGTDVAVLSGMAMWGWKGSFPASTEVIAAMATMTTQMEQNQIVFPDMFRNLVV